MLHKMNVEAKTSLCCCLICGPSHCWRVGLSADKEESTKLHLLGCLELQSANMKYLNSGAPWKMMLLDSATSNLAEQHFILGTMRCHDDRVLAM